MLGLPGETEPGSWKGAVPETLERLRPLPHLADGDVMPHEADSAPAVRYDAPAPYAVAPAASPPPDTVLLARIERAGPAALDDHELLGLVGVDFDAATLAAAGGLRELLDDPDDGLRAIPLSPAERARVHAVLELHDRWMAARLRRDGGPLTSPEHSQRYIEARLRGCRNEVFACLFLDNQHRVIAFEELFRGTLDGTRVYPRVIVRRALGHNAGAIVCAHNHPSGLACPSPADRDLTERLAEALALVDVRLVDHFVVGDGKCASFKEMGLL